jgi:hypothetical protein
MVSPNTNLEDEREYCAVCLDPIDGSKGVSTTDCEHKFHTACILMSARKNAHCPLCRHAMFDEEHLEPMWEENPHPADMRELVAELEIEDLVRTRRNFQARRRRRESKDAKLKQLRTTWQTSMKQLQRCEEKLNTFLEDKIRAITTDPEVQQYRSDHKKSTRRERRCKTAYEREVERKIGICPPLPIEHLLQQQFEPVDDQDE